MYRISNKSAQYLGRVRNNYCRKNKLNPHHRETIYRIKIIKIVLTLLRKRKMLL